MTEHDDFFARLRNDAQPLRHQPDAATLARIRSRIEARLAPRETVLDVLAAWFRPIAAAMSAVALAAAIGIAAYSVSDTSYDDAVEIVMGGETYSVGR
ncbi:MAG TPA: hypothetical protein VF608_09820 [Thermoanaerobaculia bacterium]